MDQINSVVITANLTKDPELNHTGGGTAIANLRVAVNGTRKDKVTGEWVDKPNYFDVVVWGNQGVACSEHLEKGSAVAVEGRLDWQEWEAKDGSGKRQGVKIIAEKVRFLGGASAAASGSEEDPGVEDGGASPSELPAEGGELAAAGAASEEPIQF